MVFLPPLPAVKSLDRCDTIDVRLVRLARENPNTKFIRCRASAIGFALNPQAKPRSLRPPSSTYLSKSRTSPRFSHQDDDDPYGSDTDEPTGIDALNKDEDEEDVDTDMLPTILVYRSGQLVHNWVRVDWEAGSLGIDEFLAQCVEFFVIHRKNSNLLDGSHDIIQSVHTRGSLNVPLNDEGDLVFGTPSPDEGL